MVEKSLSPVPEVASRKGGSEGRLRRLDSITPPPTLSVVISPKGARGPSGCYGSSPEREPDFASLSSE